jgi:hypothetical protein
VSYVFPQALQVIMQTGRFFLGPAFGPRTGHPFRGQ